MRASITLLLCLWAIPVRSQYSQGFSAHLRLPQADSTVFDVFPLRILSAYSYNYYSKTEYDEMIPFEVSIDSGLVVCIVRDSTVQNDSSLLWSIEETRSLKHSRFDIMSNITIEYWTSDTSLFTLLESTSGRHQLFASGLVWTFPVPPLQGDIFQANSQPVYRFADSSALLVTRGATGSAPGRSQDSLWFSSDSSLSIRYQYYLYGGMDIRSSYLVARLNHLDILGIDEPKVSSLAFELKQNYPNPFNPATKIPYNLSHYSTVLLSVYDILGRRVAEIVNSSQVAGYHVTEFDGSRLPSGTYFYRLQVGSSTKTRAMLLLK